MSREIKFRAKVADSDYENEKQSDMIGSFVHFTGFIGLENDIGYVEQLEEIHGVGWFDVDLKTLGQYTGLKDKNGKEIYEGDIVDYLGDIELANSNVLRVIEYKDEEACFVARLPIGDYSSDKAVYLNEHDFKVIGNIYENLELLEATA